MIAKFARLAGAALVLLGLAGTAAAGSATSNLSISASVSSNCSISTTAVAFGTYDPVVTNSSSGSDKTATGTVVVTCTKNASGVTIGLGLGTHASGSTRRMLGATNGDFLTYELYQPTATTPAAACTGATVWGTAGANLLTPTGVSGWGASSAKTFNVCGVATKGQDVSGTSAGESYTDTVVATVNF
jgi:spore coat protein U-like protein